MVDRRRLTAAERKEVLHKTACHCAYCGQRIDLKTMQVDHVIPLKRGGADEMGNMLPACRSCNHYKSSMTIDGFRAMLEKMPITLARDSVTYKNAVRYELVTPTPHRVRFFFEHMAALSEGGGEDSIPPVSIPAPDGMRWPF